MGRTLAALMARPVTKWIVVASWLMLVTVSTGFASRLGDVQNNEASTWLPANAESTRALAEVNRFRDGDALTTTVVYEKASGFTATDRAAMAEQAGRMQGLAGVAGEVAGPVLAEDEQAAQTTVTFDLGPDPVRRMPEVADKLREIAAMPGGDVYIAGEGGKAADEATVFAGVDGSLTLIALGVVIAILLISYRSPVLWILPIICVVAGLLVSQALIYLLVEAAGLVVNAQTQSILSILVIGAGTDYALLLVARYREELHRHADRHEAMAVALRRAFPALLASAGTVAAGLLCLAAAQLNSTAGMGPVAAIGIGMTFLAMVSLLPALLMFCGRWIFWPRKPRYSRSEPAGAGAWAWVGARLAPRPRLVWVVTVVALAAGSLGLVRLDASGLATEDQYTRPFESVTGQQVLLEHGLVDRSHPILVVADADRTGDVVDAMAAVPGLGPVSSPPGAAGGRTLVSAEQGLDPASEEAYALVRAVREAVHAVQDADPVVGGTAALNLDVTEASSRDNAVVIPLVLAVVLLILVLLLRAVVAPVLLILTVVLSFGTALGLSALLFDAVFGFAGADAAFPLYVFVFLVALGVDYNIFLMTRIREESAAVGTRTAALTALGATGGVITAAGLVLAATFTVLATIPLVALAEIGIAVALGILIDTMIVRSVLVTALTVDLGRAIWWPGKPDSHPANRKADATSARGLRSDRTHRQARVVRSR